MKNAPKGTIIIDGAQGEGGGQVLRSSLSLSAITGQPFKMINIRAHRQKPGLLRQHLTAVKATAEICSAKVKGAQPGSRELVFMPEKINGGHYHFVIGTAGSTTLVAQTVIPVLLSAREPSTLTIEGGTHNMQSPPYDFLKDSFLPILKKMGVNIETDIKKYGFYPAGGGRITFGIQPVEKLKALKLISRGEKKQFYAETLLANLDADIAKRELKTIGDLMKWSEDQLHIRQIQKTQSPGNVVLLKLEHEEVTETIVGFGIRGHKAEKVAEEACKKAKEFLASDAAVGEYLADQLLLPMALAGEGEFSTLTPSLHTLTNIDVIKKFIPCSIKICENEKQSLTKVSIKK